MLIILKIILCVKFGYSVQSSIECFEYQCKYLTDDEIHENITNFESFGEEDIFYESESRDNTE